MLSPKIKDTKSSVSKVTNVPMTNLGCPWFRIHTGLWVCGLLCRHDWV